MECLVHGRESELAELVSGQPRAIRPLTGRLWDVDPVVRRRAARALARAAAEHEAMGRELIRRLLWGLNDESGTHGVYAIPALTEMARRTPGLVAPYAGTLAALLVDDGLRAGLLEFFVELAERSPESVAPCGAEIAALRGAPLKANEQRAVERILSLVTGEADDE